eukprot:6933962-Prymnesium_polylepis.1
MRTISACVGSDSLMYPSRGSSIAASITLPTHRAYLGLARHVWDRRAYPRPGWDVDAARGGY